MLGSTSKRVFKGKAAETGALVAWACDFCRQWESTLPRGEELHAAGQSLLDWKLLIANAQIEMTPAECEQAVTLA
eukprot:5284037-Pyramimonas_sp.AAC.1